MRQQSGFQGRPNKPVDTCYSFWVGATLKVGHHVKFVPSMVRIYNGLLTALNFPRLGNNELLISLYHPRLGYNELLISLYHPKLGYNELLISLYHPRLGYDELLISLYCPRLGHSNAGMQIKSRNQGPVGSLALEL